MEPQGTPVDALMEREEIQIVLYWIMQRSGLNRNHLRALVAERLDRGTVPIFTDVSCNMT